MCGIAGFLTLEPQGRDAALSSLRGMADAITHRGPDGAGYWIDERGRIGLAHRRLAIIDLSEAGAQPMVSASGRYTIVFNGEIYGFLDLRREFEAAGHRFVGHSDTEVLLAAIERDGLEVALDRIGGMFAFAVYDRETRRLAFARDRLGKKPLYIGVANGEIAFGSELKALRRRPAFAAPSVDRGALALYTRYGYIPGAHSVYEGVAKLPAGTFVEIDVDAPPASADALVQSAMYFWRPETVAAAGLQSAIADEETALEALDAELSRAVRERLVSDVPVGVFLSGGIDSSLIAAMTREVSNAPVRTLTIRFDEQGFNEADHAAAIAEHLGTDHRELTATPAAALDVIEHLPDMFDEPMSDPSQIPTYLVSKLARDDVTVVLSGDGGDESFGGYKRYPQMLSFEKLAQRTPKLARSAAAAASAGMYDMALRVAKPVVSGKLASELSGDRLAKLAQILIQPDFRTRFREFITQWGAPEELVLGAVEPPSTYRDAVLPDGLDPLGQMMLLDTIAYLNDDVLTKVDRASMAVSLEVRSPLLDYRVVETAWRCPPGLRIGDDGETTGVGKVALRRLLARRLPRALYDRPKKGFSVPMNDWLRGPLKERAADLLSEDRLRRDGVFAPAPITKKLQEHLDGSRNWGQHLWTIMVFNQWRDRWMSA